MITNIEKPCSMNFTRVGNTCYLFVTNQLTNWKTANTVCRSYGAHLAELEGANENNDIAAYLLNHQSLASELNGNFWLGGLNPGLLWIWSTSARPVNPNVNLTQIQNSPSPSVVSHITPKVSTKIDNHSKKAIINKKGGSSANATATGSTTTKKPVEISKKIATEEDYRIEGNGRCLGLSYKANKHIYQMYGLDCTSQQKFICELPEDHLDNEIDRIAKKLFQWYEWIADQLHLNCLYLYLFIYLFSKHEIKYLIWTKYFVNIISQNQSQIVNWADTANGW